MQIEEKLNKGLERKYHVVIDPKKLDEFISQEAFKLSTTTKIDGFRPGKTPLSLIKSTHKFALQSKASEHFIQEAIKKIVTDNKIQLASQPVLNDIDNENDKMSFTLEMELLPEIPSLDLAKISLDKYIGEVGQKEIKKAEDEFLKHHKTFEASKAAAAKGDITVIDAIGYMEGKEFDGGKVTDHKLELGSNAFIKGFEDGLIGVKAGDKKTLKLKFPKDYHMKDCSGKDVEFAVTVKEVQKPKAAKVDDALVKKLQAKDKKEIENKIKESAQEYYNQLSELIMRKEMLDYLDKNIKIDLPPKILAQEIETIKKSEEGKNHNEKEIQKLADRRTKLGLIMARVSQENKIEVKEEDIRTEITKQMQRMPEQSHAIVEFYKKNPSAADALRGQILENKTMLFMLGKIKANQKKVTPGEISEIYSEITKRHVE